MIINPTNRIARSLTTAEGYLELGMPKQALSELETIKDAGPFRVPHIWLIGEALKADGRFEDAIEPLQSVTHLLPHMVRSRALQSLNECLEKTGRKPLTDEEVGAIEAAPNVDATPEPTAEQSPAVAPAAPRKTTSAVKLEIPMLGTVSVQLEPGNVLSIKIEPKAD